MRIGITGHQQLDDQTAWIWVTNTMRDIIYRLSPQPIGITCLAVGTDQIFANLILQGGGRIHAIIPFVDIERSFASDQIAIYRRLVSQATVEILTTPGTDEDAYLAAGQRIVDLSTIVLAVWDGMPARGKGGTADVVAYAIKQDVSVIHMNPISRIAKHIAKK